MVCEESETTTNIQLYEIKQMSFAIKLNVKYNPAITNTFNAFVAQLVEQRFCNPQVTGSIPAEGSYVL